MHRTLILLFFLLAFLTSKADYSPVFYLKCDIELQNDSSLTTYIELDGYYVRDNSFKKPNSFMLTMENKVEDDHFLNLIKTNYSRVKSYEYATRIPLKINGYDYILGYVNENDFVKIKVGSIKEISIKDIIGSRRDLGVYIVSTLTSENEFWNKEPINIYNVTGCRYSPCGFTVYEYSHHAELEPLIELLNREQQPCWDPANKQATTEQLERWNSMRNEIANMNNVIVLGTYCND
ncbi:hypothetical protein [Ekhidna sp. To15]|uniref:hypothetical protein n=1 Tax=Ekhidna sp. To15 TaxID=3395267 RepID=UPI003F522FF3